MIDLEVPALAPRRFREAVEHVRAQHLRSEVVVEAVPPPLRLAPHALALSGEVGTGRSPELATGRFVLLHDPDGQEAWQGAFRAVVLARAVLEPELATDPLLGRVARAWLTEALAAHEVPAAVLGGTVTRVLSEHFGALDDRAASVEVEVRASWTPPEGLAGASAAAWVDLLCTAGGLPPLPSGVTALPRRAH